MHSGYQGLQMFQEKAHGIGGIPCQSAATPEPKGYNYRSPHAQSPCYARRKATAMRSLCTTTRKEPLLATLEKVHVQQQRPRSSKNVK